MGVEGLQLSFCERLLGCESITPGAVQFAARNGVTLKSYDPAGDRLFSIFSPFAHDGWAVNSFAQKSAGECGPVPFAAGEVNPWPVVNFKVFGAYFFFAILGHQS
jgi:hypothetical protein